MFCSLTTRTLTVFHAPLPTEGGTADVNCHALAPPGVAVLAGDSRFVKCAIMMAGVPDTDDHRVVAARNHLQLVECVFLAQRTRVVEFRPEHVRG